MKRQNRNLDKQNGSALILVVVVTVLLAVIGVMFLMVSRTAEMETAAVIQTKDLNNAVDTVVSRINEVLVDDLFTSNGDFVSNPHNATDKNPWLSDLEPDSSSGSSEWLYISYLYDEGANRSLTPAVASGVIDNRADADGDGVADSRWVEVPHLTSSRGEPVFAAVRIIDNCAMLNLNNACGFFTPARATWDTGQWEFDAGTRYHENLSGSGRYLTEINYTPFLRGSDTGNIKQIQEAKDPLGKLLSPQGFHNHLVIQIEDPFYFDGTNDTRPFHPFDIADELEMRNRYLLTSNVESRLEQEAIAHFSLDAKGGIFQVLRTPVDDMASWLTHLNADNFDSSGSSDPFKYDRRHICTVYSYDRMIPRGQYSGLDAEFDDLAIDEDWTQQQTEQAKKVFWPVGPVTTNIAVPIYNPISGEYENNWNNSESRRRILHLLFAFREYFRGDPTPAKRAAQMVANIIDYSDDDAPNNQILGESEGPFYEPRYGQQANVDHTFLTEQIIQDMMIEVSGAILGRRNSFSIPFGLDPDPTDSTEDMIVFGYERQPFISEVYVQWDDGVDPTAEPRVPKLRGFAIELINPYDTPIDISGWKLKIGSIIDHEIDPGSTTIVPSRGRLVIHINNTGAYSGGADHNDITGINWLDLENEIDTGKEPIVLLKRLFNFPGDFLDLNTGYLYVDSVSSTDLQEILVGYPDPSAGPAKNSLKRDDKNWGFVLAQYDESRNNIQRESKGTFTDTLGQSNDPISLKGFQLAVVDDGQPLSRWHELEVLSLYGSEPESNDPNAEFDPDDVITGQLPYADPNHFDLTKLQNNPLDYVATINRPDLGTLPGRININTAPIHVIAAAIPPSLVDPDIVSAAPSGYSSLNLAQGIVAERKTNGAYTKLTDLLRVPRMKQYSTDGEREGENVGNLSITDDIEEEHWILSNLANKLTVRSDVFTAYILVRLGKEGPQRRMIGIFDRSQVWTDSDRPKLVALHPVPDPR